MRETELRQLIRKSVAEIRELDTLSRSGDRPTVEHHIRKLVIMLRVMGIQTSSSCHGHRQRPPGYPYVDLPRSERVRLTPLVAEWNRGLHRPNWTMTDRGQDIRLMPECPSQRDLPEMQASAERLGEFLLNLAKRKILR